MMPILTPVAFFRIRYCKARMVAYINGELPAAARRRIASYIDRYPECYADYIHQRDAVRDLRARLPLVGQPDQPTLDRMWMAIQSELVQRPTARPMMPPFRLRYGLVGLTMAFTLVLPFTFGNNRAVFALSLSQPVPQTATAQPSDTTTAVMVGMRANDMTRVIVTHDTVTPPAPALPQATAVSTES